MKKLFVSLVSLVLGSALLVSPVFAECTAKQLEKGCVSTSILSGGCSCDDGKGSGVVNVLNLVLDILTGVVGIAGIIGISVAGIQYLSAKGGEENVRKAKRRIYEIVIGLAVYAVAYVALRWLGVG